MVALVLTAFGIISIVLIIRISSRSGFRLLPPDKKDKTKVENNSKIVIEKSEPD